MSAKIRTIKNDYYGDITLSLWPHGDLGVTCGDSSLYLQDHEWRDTGADSGYPECDGSLFVFNNFEIMPNLLYFFDNC